jgi:hypothetical protein
MKSKLVQLKQRPNREVQDDLEEINASIDRSSANVRLKDRVTEALGYTYGQVGTQGSLPEEIRTQVIERLKELWKIHYKDCITAFISNLELFLRTCEQLLQNAAYVTAEHRNAREGLQSVLDEFTVKLINFQGHFNDIDEQYSRKKNKNELVKDESSARERSITPAIDPRDAVLVRHSAPPF